MNPITYAARVYRRDPTGFQPKFGLALMASGLLTVVLDKVPRIGFILFWVGVAGSVAIVVCGFCGMLVAEKPNWPNHYGPRIRKHLSKEYQLPRKRKPRAKKPKP